MSSLEDGIRQVWVTLLESISEAYTGYASADDDDIVIKIANNVNFLRRHLEFLSIAWRLQLA